MAKRMVEFLRKKDYEFVEEIGQGGTGKTVLLKDDLIDGLFVCKKYSPYYESDRNIYFRNFVDEIKLLHLIYHRNIIRIFNYYLYPDQVTGYILMEYVRGLDIGTYLSENPDKINSIFSQVVEGFKYLEYNGILHRDIRPLNILVTNDGVVKIIDFGFGKKMEFDDSFSKSISLNWPYSTPDEFNQKIYDFKTEVYFVGKLFESIMQENMVTEFSYKEILKEMLQNYDERIGSFFEVSRKITEEGTSYIDFNEYEKEVYRSFAGSLVSVFKSIDDNATYLTDVDNIVQGLENLYQYSMLEEYVHNIVGLTQCFVKGQYTYYKNSRKFAVYTLLNFIKLLKSLSNEKRKIVVAHLWGRLDNVTRESSFDDLPF